MKSTFKSYVLAWVILLIVFNIVVFVVPDSINGMNKFGGAFWSGYVLITLAFIGQLFCAHKAFDTDNRQKFFYNIPLISVSYSALLISAVAGTVCMAVPNIPNWVGIIVCALILGFQSVSIIKAAAAADIIEHIDEKLKAKTSFIKSLTAEAKILMDSGKTEEIKIELKNVFETIRYSDPMRSSAIENEEAEISKKFSDLKESVKSGNLTEIKNVSETFINSVKLRNEKCKLLK